MVDGALEPDEMAPVVRRIFSLRADGLSYRSIEEQTGFKYSTVRQILHNRAHLGEVKHKTDWYAGIHPPLVTPAEFAAAHRGHLPGRRRSRDLLSGRVRCGECKRVLGVEYNDRSQAIYRCKHRGQGCDLPGRSARGLQRAAVLGLALLGEDQELRAAIRAELHRHLDPAPDEDTAATIASLKRKRQRLLDLYYEDKITPDAFEEEERRLTTLIGTLQTAHDEHTEQAQARSELAQRFEQVAQLLAGIDIDTIWNEADEKERRVLVEDLVDAIYIYADHLQVAACGAPPLRVNLDEVGLRPPAGMGPFVSEGGATPLTHRRSVRVATRRDEPLLGGLRVTDRGIGHPHGACRVVDAVPDAATGGDFELPLLEVVAVHGAGSEGALERMLTVVAVSRVGGDAIPRSSGIRRGGRGDLLPTLHRVARGETELRPARRRRRCDTLAAFRHRRSADGTLHVIAHLSDRTGEPLLLYQCIMMLR